MPEVFFKVQWPDAKTAEYYSPSTAIHAHFKTGDSFVLSEFLDRSRKALHQAAERVRMKYGYYCSSAMDTLSQIESTAESFTDQPEAQVKIIRCG